MPTDTLIQHIAQHMTPTHWGIVLGLIFASLVTAIVICLVGVWREVRRGDEQIQQQLARSTERARRNET